jgi:hypothetical protein
MRVASLLLALTAAPAVRAAPTGRTKHLHKLEADVHEFEKMDEYVFGRSFDKTNPDVCSREVDSCDDALPDILKRHIDKRYEDPRDFRRPREYKKAGVFLRWADGRGTAADGTSMELEGDYLTRAEAITDDECAKYKTMDDSGEYIVCRKPYSGIGCASQRGWKPKRFCNDLVGFHLGVEKRRKENVKELQLAQYLTGRKHGAARASYNDRRFMIDGDL